MDTIFALSTAPGKAGVAIIRVSGPAAHEAVNLLCGDVPPPRKASLRILRDRTGHRLDEALVLTFTEDHSFTGESSAEFQVHGSKAVTDALLVELEQLDGLRAAEAGEFTRRALENGMLDLAQVEGLADLIDAETEAQRVRLCECCLATSVGRQRVGAKSSFGRPRFSRRRLILPMKRYR